MNLHLINVGLCWISIRPVDVAEDLAVGRDHQGGEDNGGQAEDEGEQCHHDDGHYCSLFSYFTPQRFHNHYIPKYK